MLSRNTHEVEHLQTLAPDILFSFIPCDLASIRDIRRAVSDLAQLAHRLDVLFCNSALCMVPADTTADGYEIQFGVNHLGHAVLIKLLMPLLIQTSAHEPEDVRIIIVSSHALAWAPRGGINFDDLDTEQRRLTTKERYGQSKLANLLYARELALKYPALKTVAVYPGIADTNLMSHQSKTAMRYDKVVRAVTKLYYKICGKTDKGASTPAAAAEALVWCAMTPKAEVENGGFYDPGGVSGGCTSHGRNMLLGAALWDWTARIVERVPMEPAFVPDST